MPAKKASPKAKASGNYPYGVLCGRARRDGTPMPTPPKGRDD